MKDIFCFIPAKSNSNRLKNKNCHLLNGKPLFYYPISAAIKSGIFDKNGIIVSSDSNEIISKSEKYGAVAPYLRPKHLSRDPSGVYDVLIHFLNKFPLYKKYKYVCILLPTSPLTDYSDIILSFKNIKNSNFSCLMSISESQHNAHLSVVVNNEIIKPLFEDKILIKSSDLEKTYHLNGAIHIVKINELLKKQTYIIHPILGYEMPFERSVDVDEKKDIQLAEFIISQKC